MCLITLNIITGTPPYTVEVCDVFGSNCVTVAYITGYVPPDFDVIVPPPYDVAPILKENCFACHGSKNPKGKLDMTKYEALRHGGTKDDPIVVGKPDESYFIDVLKATDKSRMPPKESGDALSPEKIKILEKVVSFLFIYEWNEYKSRSINL